MEALAEPIFRAISLPLATIERRECWDKRRATVAAELKDIFCAKYNLRLLLLAMAKLKKLNCCFQNMKDVPNQQLPRQYFLRLSSSPFSNPMFKNVYVYLLCPRFREVEKQKTLSHHLFPVFHGHPRAQEDHNQDPLKKPWTQLCISISMPW